MQRRKWSLLVLLRKLLTCAICSITLVALFSVHLHIFPSSKVPMVTDPYKLPSQHEIWYQKLSSERNLVKEFSRPHLSKAPLPSLKLVDAIGILDVDKLWKPPPNCDFVPCVESSSNYTSPAESRGYLLVNTNGGLNQMRVGAGVQNALSKLEITSVESASEDCKDKKLKLDEQQLLGEATCALVSGRSVGNGSAVLSHSLG